MLPIQLANKDREYLILSNLRGEEGDLERVCDLLSLHQKVAKILFFLLSLVIFHLNVGSFLLCLLYIGIKIHFRRTKKVHMQECKPQELITDLTSDQCFHRGELVLLLL